MTAPRACDTPACKIAGFLATLLGRRPPYLQVGALCLRRNRAQDLEVLMISSLRRGRWIIPKGWPMKGRSLAGAALREAWEEAGVHGKVSSRPIGRYHYDKERAGGLPLRCEVRVFRVDVDHLDDDHPEAGRRKRHWMHPREAAGLVDEPGLAALLEGLAPR
ncbi:NUDIX hydrolase [Phaeovulum vinaykumarii]|uniref:8-oxo-dGTP pyrophosphatase MutT, NUDIX family n=1 Tax=Phaeovulum vinaykumarii TaxID=407234 RepID=A0A1N7KB83_9RHOB|nr:NUDIX hydrolase [Phaeovulum vinaykumarii]SIS58813.1 8-oxo-dGTP pyrophosphatase MutT, NUDIX family [Phaeovulum vinaykumarii]SOB93926.1 8-oxo-dGTP pyrophosphatase MutT (NUDIX family) [Phaeovulum vinaykumarii]